MTKEAESHAAEDKKRREVVDLKNQAVSLTFQTDKQLKEFGDKISGDLKAKIESANEKLKEAAPQISRVAFLGQRSSWEALGSAHLRKVAAALGLTLIHAEFNVVDDFEASERSSGGFGSTGRH